MWLVDTNKKDGFEENINALASRIMQDNELGRVTRRDFTNQKCCWLFIDQRRCISCIRVSERDDEACLDICPVDLALIAIELAVKSKQYCEVQTVEFKQWNYNI